MFIYHFNRMIRSRILWLVFAIVVGAAFLALPSCFTGDPSGRAYAGTLGKERISQAEYANASLFVERFLRQQDLPPAATETQVWAHIAAMHTAKEMGLAVSDEELRAAILSVPAFQSDGAFDHNLYERLIQQNFGLTTSGWEHLLADQMLLAKLMRAVGAGYTVSPMEIDDEVSARTDAITFQCATVSNAFATAALDLSDDDVRAYYEEHRDDYALPDRVSVRFATLSATNFLSAAKVEEEDILDYYEDNASQYTRSGTNGVEAIPLDEVRDAIRREVAMGQAVHMASTNLAGFVESLATNDLETFTWRCQARGMKTADTPLFPLTAPFIAGVAREAVEEFREMAHDLDPAVPDRLYGVVEGKDCIYLLRAVTNDAAHTQTYEEVEGSLRPLALAAQRQKKFDEAARSTRAALAAALTNNADFAAAAAAQGLVASTSITFTVEGLAPAAFDNARAIVPAVVRLGAGEISEPIQTYNAALLAYVSARADGDAAAVQRCRDSILSDAERMEAPGFAAFQDWQIWNLARMGFSSTRLPSLEAAAAEAAADDEED